ncbi:tyrosine-type recombinase/integrase, partial [Frateuria defendens]|uniref:tyrosine-type recombinase/integrase n=1 Tax=Frateuria defendens TaxID=2219559 RepID=UPI0012935EAD
SIIACIEATIFAEAVRLDVLDGEPRFGPPRKADAYKYVRLYTVLLDSGMRLGEALNLLPSDIDYGTEENPGIIKLHRVKELKNGKARTVPMTKRCRAALMECRDVPGGPFKDLYRRRAQAIWKAATKNAGVTNPECVIHSPRETSNWSRSG